MPFVDKLTQAIALKRADLNGQALPAMQKDYTELSSVVKILQTNLLKKGLIHNDPYKYDSRMTEIKVPPSDPFTEKEAAAVIGSRLEQYETMLDFLINSYQFHCNYLTPQRVSSMITLNKTFNWGSLNEQTNNPNSKGLAEIIKSVQDSSDTLTAGLLRDSLTHLAKLYKKIDAVLAAITNMYREEYKLLARKHMPENLEIEQPAVDFSEKILKTISKHFSSKSINIPFYHDLVSDVLKEDYGPDSEELQKSIIEHLIVHEKKQTLEKKQADIQLILLSGIKMIGATGSQLSMCMQKITSNQEIIDKAQTTIFTKLIAAIKSAFNIPEKKHEIVILIKNDGNQIQKKQTVVIEDFTEDLEKKIRLFKNLSSPSPHIQKKLRSMSKEELFSFLSKYINTCKEYLRIFNGLDEYYKNVDLLLRSKMKGIKIELTTIQNNVLKANQCRAEYIASVEEQMQMKKLGIPNEK